MIALVQPPFFRIVGSHNDKIAPSLLFLASKLKARGEEVVIVNADAGGSRYYTPWRQLYSNFQFYKDTVERGSPIIYDAFEKVMQHNPEAVILGAGDFLAATVDFGSPFIAMHLARLLKKTGKKVYGFGPLWHEGFFDIEIWHDDILPLPQLDFRLIPQDSKYDIVFTKVGCPYRCAFCLQPKYLGKWERVPDDVIRSQLRLERHYIEDPVFAPDSEVVNILSGRRYICEARVDRVNPKWVEQVKKIGVELVKLGIESGSQSFLDKTGKGTNKDDTKSAIDLLKEAGIKVVAYIMLGWYGVSEKDYWDSLDYFSKLEADYYVVNTTCSYGQGGRDWRFDTHFSPEVARFWGLSDSLVYAYFELQEGKTNPSLI